MTGTEYVLLLAQHEGRRRASETTGRDLVTDWKKTLSPEQLAALSDFEVIASGMANEMATLH